MVGGTLAACGPDVTPRVVARPLASAAMTASGSSVFTRFRQLRTVCWTRAGSRARNGAPRTGGVGEEIDDHDIDLHHDHRAGGVGPSDPADRRPGRAVARPGVRPSRRRQIPRRRRVRATDRDRPGPDQGGQAGAGAGPGHDARVRAHRARRERARTGRIARRIGCLRVLRPEDEADHRQGYQRRRPGDPGHRRPRTHARAPGPALRPAEARPGGADDDARPESAAHAGRGRRGARPERIREDDVGRRPGCVPRAPHGARSSVAR